MTRGLNKSNVLSLLDFFFSSLFLLEITFIQEGAPRKSYKHENLCITVPLTARAGNSMTQVFHRGSVQDEGCLKPVHVDLKPKRSPGCVPDTEKRDKSTALWSKKVRFFSKKEARSGYSGLAWLPEGLGFSSTANGEMLK